MVVLPFSPRERKRANPPSVLAIHVDVKPFGTSVFFAPDFVVRKLSNNLIHDVPPVSIFNAHNPIIARHGDPMAYFSRICPI